MNGKCAVTSRACHHQMTLGVNICVLGHVLNQSDADVANVTWLSARSCWELRLESAHAGFVVSFHRRRPTVTLSQR